MESDNSVNLITHRSDVDVWERRARRSWTIEEWLGQWVAADRGRQSSGLWNVLRDPWIAARSVVDGERRQSPRLRSDRPWQSVSTPGALAQELRARFNRCRHAGIIGFVSRK